MIDGIISNKSPRIAIWNVAWAGKASPRGKILHDSIFSLNPDIVCITEGLTDWMPKTGSVISSNADFGYSLKPGRRKILLWSRTPWHDVDSLGNEMLLGGRFVSGVTETNRGKVEVIGVCIPWADAHVRTGRKDRLRWEDHKACLAGLKQYLNAKEFRYPTMIVGDFNQTIPRHKQPKEVSNLLSDALIGSFTVATTGMIPGVNKPSIDHLAHTRGITITRVDGLTNETENTNKLSDHFGLCVDFSVGKSESEMHRNDACQPT